MKLREDEEQQNTIQSNGGGSSLGWLIIALLIPTSIVFAVALEKASK